MWAGQGHRELAGQGGRRALTKQVPLCTGPNGGWAVAAKGTGDQLGLCPPPHAAGLLRPLTSAPPAAWWLSEGGCTQASRGFHLSLRGYHVQGAESPPGAQPRPCGACLCCAHHRGGQDLPGGVSNSGHPHHPGFSQGSLRAVRTAQCSHQTFPGARRAQHPAGGRPRAGRRHPAPLHCPPKPPGRQELPVTWPQPLRSSAARCRLALLTLRPLLCALERQSSVLG